MKASLSVGKGFVTDAGNVTSKISKSLRTVYEISNLEIKWYWNQFYLRQSNRNKNVYVCGEMVVVEIFP